MPTTITQARGLLTAAELALFEASRAAQVGAHSAARLAQKIQRTRALRDKFRDLYQRQMVRTQRATAGSERLPKGGDNARTQKKAEVMAEVLSRLEAQLPKTQRREARASATTATVGRAARSRSAASTASNAPTASKKASGGARVATKTAALAKQKPSSKAAGVDMAAGPAVTPAPVDVTPNALRRHALKTAPRQRHIQASRQAMNQRQQAKRDAR